MCYGIFFVMVFFSVFLHAGKTSSLKAIVSYFDGLKKIHQNNNDLYSQFSLYQNALIDACYMKKRDMNAPYHAWCRAEIARTLYTFGFDIFINHIKPYLNDWHVLASDIVNITPDRFQNVSNWKGASVFFSKSKKHDTEYGGLGLSDRSKENSNNAREIYVNGTSYDLLLRLGRDEAINLLSAPHDGLLFWQGFFYGCIDYQKKKAIVYHSLNDNQEKAIDFSRCIPWDVLLSQGAGKASIFFSKDRMCLSFWEFIPHLGNQNPSGQIVYKIITSDPDLSCPESYKSLERDPKKYSDSMSNLSKYSHARISFNMYEFCIKKAAREVGKKDNLALVKIKNIFFFCSSATLLAFITTHGVMVLASALLDQSFLGTGIVKRLMLSSGFISLLIGSCFFRGILFDFIKSQK